MRLLRIRLCVVTAGFMLITGIPSVARVQNTEAELLPPGPGRDVVLAKCGLCHSVRNIVAAGKQTEQFWRETVEEMYYEAGWDEDEDQKVIIDYLFKAFGKEDAAAALGPVPSHVSY